MSSKSTKKKMSEVVEKVVTEEVENECKVEKRRETICQLIYKYSILRNAKCQLLQDSDKSQVLPYYVKLPYPSL